MSRFTLEYLNDAGAVVTAGFDTLEAAWPTIEKIEAAGADYALERTDPTLTPEEVEGWVEEMQRTHRPNGTMGAGYGL